MYRVLRFSKLSLISYPLLSVLLYINPFVFQIILEKYFEVEYSHFIENNKVHILHSLNPSFQCFMRESTVSYQIMSNNFLNNPFYRIAQHTMISLSSLSYYHLFYYQILDSIPNPFFSQKSIHSTHIFLSLQS